MALLPLPLLPVLLLVALAAALALAVASRDRAREPFQDPDEILHEVASPNYVVRVQDTGDPRRGKCLSLDGRVQLCDRDEHVYHEMLVHFPCRYLEGGAPKRVAIFAGGDCMALREVLKYPTVEQVVVFEWDEHLISAAERHLFADAARGLAKVTWVIGNPKTNVLKFHGAHQLQTFDLVVVDPKRRPGVSPFDAQFYKDARLLMSPSGVLVYSGGSSPSLLKTFASCVEYAFASASTEEHSSMVVCADFDLHRKGVAETLMEEVHMRFYHPDEHATFLKSV